MLHRPVRTTHTRSDSRNLSRPPENDQEEKIDPGKAGREYCPNRKVVYSKVRLAVCIPTLDASSAWKTLRASLQAQILQPSEVLVIDSSSSDGTAELATRDKSRVVVISRAEFCHGGTRQHAAELLADADILVYLTQDAILADASALARHLG